MYLKILAYIGITTICIMTIFIHKNAEARIGGGRSFGGRPFMNKPFTRPLSPNPTTPQKIVPATQSQTTTTPFLGGMGGLFGGILAGSLIVSLLSGHGFSSNGGFFDILVLLGLLYISFKLFFRKKAGQTSNTNSYSTSTSTTNFPHATGWEALQDSTPQIQTIKQPNILNFDEEEFLSGAKATYIRLNKSWDERNINDITQFTTPAFIQEIKQQYKDDPTPSKTEIMLINASIVEVKTIQEKDTTEELVSVYFNVLLRENDAQEAPNEIQEMWNFVRPINGSWKLDGIQQIEHK